MISAETVTRVVERLSNSSPANAQRLMKTMSREQPLLVTYLLAGSQDKAFDQDESDDLFFIGTVLLQVAKEAHLVTGPVTEEELERAEKANEDFLEKLDSDSEGDFISAAEFSIREHPEPELLRYMTEALMQDDEGNPENPPFREESLGPAFLYLRVVLDALVLHAKSLE